MKKLIDKVPLAAVVLIVFAFISVVWASQQSDMAVNDAKYDDIVTLSAPEADPDNEGRLVAVYDKLTLYSGPTENETGLHLGCAILVRVTDMYQYVLEDDTVYRMYSPVSNKNIKGRNGELYENPEFPEEYETKVMLGDVLIGEEGKLRLGQGILESLIKTDFSDGKGLWEQLDPDIEIEGFTKNSSGTFSNSKTDKPKIGDIRIRYYYLTCKALGEVLTVGRQEGDEIVWAGDSLSEISLTSKNIEELKAEKLDDHASASRGLYIIGALEFAAAVAVLAVSAVKRRKLTGGGKNA